jgi:hypothetical protein
MEDEKKQPEPEVGGADFFIRELARMEHEQTQMYRNLSRRIATVEQKGKSTDDPEKMLTSFFMVLLVIQVLPLIIDVVKSLWDHPLVSSQLSE